MDVTCERCSTAYEFDDALVSERGTTVKCTNCGHQFKVRRPQPAGAPERWLVRTIDGRELEFRALRELQAAISQALITRDDVLSRGGSRPRRLGSIAELEPFFAAALSSPSQHPTNLGLGPKVPVRVRPVPAAPASRPETSVAIPLRDTGILDDDTRVMGAARRPSVPPPPRRSTPPPPLPGVVVPPTGAPPPPVIIDDPTTTSGYVPGGYDAAREPARRDVSQPTAPFLIGHVVDAATARAFDDGLEPPARPPSRDDWTQPPPPADPPVSDRGRASGRPEAPSEPPGMGVPTSSPRPHALSEPGNVATPTPGVVRVSYAPDEVYGEPRFSQVASVRRTGAARWIVGLFVAGMVVLAFATIGRRLLVSSAPQPSATDARVIGLLVDGEKSLADGDLELAKEQFDKASALAERDPRVAADLARLAVTKADAEWLRARLLLPDDPDQPAARRELEQAVQRARRAADKAAEVALADATVTRSRIDALRLAGDLDAARKLVSALAGGSSAPENALVLAALDLAETKPDWSTVVGRLRTAVGGEGNLGRARALLVYALARSSDLPGARAELDRLKALPRPHPLLGALTTFLARAEKAEGAAPDASGKPRAASSSAPSSALPSAAPVAVPGPLPREPAPVRDRPSPAEPRPVAPAPEPISPTGPIDTSDLPGVKVPVTPQPPPSPPPGPAPQPTPPPTPPGVDTSDLPGFK